MSIDNSKIQIIYDGDCPICNAYVNYIRLKESFSHVEIINARNMHDMVSEYLAKGYDLNNGMVVTVNGMVYFGSSAVHVISLMSADNGVIRKMNKWIFSSEKRAKYIYPFLRTVRNIFLMILQRKKL